MKDHSNFDLLIRKAGERYQARVVSSPAGEASSEFDLPFSGPELESFIMHFGQTYRTERSLRAADESAFRSLREFGGQLYDAVFSGPVYVCLQRSLGIDGRQGAAGLRIRLDLSEAPELIDVPWEYLFDADSGRFLTLSVDTPVVRYLPLPGRVSPLPIQPPLRILVMISSPDGFLRLDVEQEWRKLKEAVADLESRGLVVLERMTKPTLAELQRRLRLQEVHIFHFIGHGGFDEATQNGLLLLETEDGKAKIIDGQYLGTLLHDEGTLRLAVLNACEGGRTSRQDPFAGVSQSLVLQGLPAVVATPFDLSDEAAIALAHELYAALADSYPVDAALAEVRKAIFAQDNMVEWGAPMLTMRNDGQIFDLVGTRVSGDEKASDDGPPPAATSRNIRPILQTAGREVLKAHYGESWVLVIGINEYTGGIPPLTNALNDARAVATILEEKYGFDHAITLLDRAATQDEIMAQLRDHLPAQLAENDRLVIFFAGHGVSRGTADGETNQKGYLIPQDARQGKYASFIDMAEVKEACRFIKAKHVFIILDCCFSGVAAVASMRLADVLEPTVMSDAYLRKITETPAQQILTAGTTDELVADSGDRPGHSAFTGVLLDALEGGADRDNDGIITASDLAAYVKPAVARQTVSGRVKGQLPFFNYLAAGEQGDFVFVRPDRKVIIQPARQRGVSGVTGKRSNALLLGVLALLVLAVVGAVFYAAGSDARARSRVFATMTAWAGQANAAQTATTTAVANDPHPIQTAVAATQAAEKQARETEVAATVAVLFAATPTLQPTPTDTATLAPTPSETPDLAATEQAQAAASTRQAQLATRVVAMFAAAQTATATTSARARTGDFSIAGASTLEGLTDAVLEQLRKEGYVGNVDRRYRKDGGTAIGTDAGFRDFCAASNPADVVLSTGRDRENPYLTPEQCPAGRTPIGFPVGWGKVDIGTANERYEPLYLFTSQEILRTKPQVAAFIRFYLEHVDDFLPRFNDLYKSISTTQLNEAKARLDMITH